VHGRVWSLVRFFLAMPVQVYAWLGRPVYTYFVTLALTLA
jgi:hypothetical protein